NDPPAGDRRVLAEPGVHDHRRVALTVDRPDEVVERHRQVVIVDRAREIGGRGALVPGVADRVDASDGCQALPPPSVVRLSTHDCGAAVDPSTGSGRTAGGRRWVALRAMEVTRYLPRSW